MQCHRCRPPRPASRESKVSPQWVSGVCEKGGDGVQPMRTGGGDEAMERTWVRFPGKLTLCHTTHIATVSTPAGRWITVQGRFKMQAPTSYCAHTRQDTVNSAGRWMKVQGQFKMQAHSSSGVAMDIAAFKVSHSVGVDNDATALQAKKRSA